MTNGNGLLVNKVNGDQFRFNLTRTENWPGQALYIGTMPGDAKEEPSLHVFDSNLFTFEADQPSNEEIFESLAVGDTFTIDGYRDANGRKTPSNMRFVKVAENGYVVLTPWKLHDGYFDQNGRGLRLDRPGDLDPDFTIVKEVS